MTNDDFDFWMDSMDEYSPLMIDYSYIDDFWDSEHKRSLSIEQAVAEGYFKNIKEAREYYKCIGGDDEDKENEL